MTDPNGDRSKRPSEQIDPDLPLHGAGCSQAQRIQILRAMDVAEP